MPRRIDRRIDICGLPPREDGEWYRLGYLSHKCGRCPFVADYVRVTPGKRAEYRCAKCKAAAGG